MASTSIIAYIGSPTLGLHRRSIDYSNDQVSSAGVVAAEEQRHHPNETVFASAMASAFGKRALLETLDLKAAGIPALEAQSGDSECFLDDPHALANDMVSTHQHPKAGELRLARQYIRFHDTETPKGRVTLLLGEHTIGTCCVKLGMAMTRLNRSSARAW